MTTASTARSAVYLWAPWAEREANEAERGQVLPLPPKWQEEERHSDRLRTQTIVFGIPDGQCRSVECFQNVFLWLLLFLKMLISIPGGEGWDRACGQDAFTDIELSTAVPLSAVQGSPGSLMV